MTRYLRMIPVLQAEESLLMASRVALGTGSLKKGDARALQRQWERQTGRTRRRGMVDQNAVRALGIVMDDEPKGGTQT